MSRTVTSNGLIDIQANSTGAAFFTLIEIQHAALAAPLYFCDSRETITYGGNPYLGFPFKISLPSDDDQLSGTARISIDNVDRQIVTALRTILTNFADPPTATVVIVRTRDGSSYTAELGPLVLMLKSATYDAFTATFELQYENRLDNNIPMHCMTPVIFPGIFY
jgi:hypothetical protein